MPLYEYECEKCSHRFEVIQRFADDPLTTCPECRGAVRRLLSAPAVQFKGSGWYVTDYGGKKGAAASSPEESKGESKSEAKGEGEGSAKGDKGEKSGKGASTGGSGKAGSGSSGGGE